MKWRKRRRGAKQCGNRKEWTFLQPKEGQKAFRTIPDNPCIPYLRTVVEAVLGEKGISYREFYPVVLDFDEEALRREFSDEESGDILIYELEREILRLERQISSVLGQLAPGLNRMMIRTARPAYFADFCEKMFEDEGLVVELSDVAERTFPAGSFVLDLGLWGEFPVSYLRPDISYLPIYRKPWEIAGNLDILAPIGYNTVIVKGAAGARYVSAEDRFEQEFYRK